MLFGAKDKIAFGVWTMGLAALSAVTVRKIRNPKYDKNNK
jgi:hypothetical protein